jgi:hypothetical protein
MSTNTEQREPTGNKTDSVSEPSIASILMLSGGNTIALAGSFLSVGSGVYMIKYISTMTCSAIEYFPELLKGGAPAFSTFVKGKELGNVYAYGWLIGFLGIGIGLRKFGTILCSPKNVKTVESYMYKK